MGLSTYVYWGTGAGWKPEKPKPTEPWTCANGHANPPYAKNCIEKGCYERRPY